MPAPSPVSVAAHFRDQRSAARNAREPVADFLTRWISQASDAELAQLSLGKRPWTRHHERPILYEAFFSDSAFDNRLKEILHPLQLLLQRMPALETEAPWQSLMARAQLDAGDLDAALESARLAWLLDARLCADDCSPLLDAWLQTGEVPAPEHWPDSVIPAVYNASSVECESTPDSLQPAPLVWAIPEQELVGAVRGPIDRIAWLLREDWQSVLMGCQRGAQWHLSKALDDEFSSFELNQAWYRLQRDIDVWTADGAAVSQLVLLGQPLPLPAGECDFAADPTCGSGFQPLTRDSVRTMVDNLRSASRSFNDLQICPVPELAGLEPFSLETQRDLRAAVARLDSLPLVDALAALRDLLADQRWARMWAVDVPSEVSDLMARLAREDPAVAEQSLQLAETWLTAGPASLQDSASAGDLMAVQLLRNGRAKEALDHLRRAQQRFANQDRAQRISQLQAGLVGADLDASLPRAQIPRPWNLGERAHDQAVARSLPFERSSRLDGVQMLDVVYGLGGARAVSRRQLRLLWLSWLLYPEARDELVSQLKHGYGDVDLRDRLLASIADLRSSPAPHLVFDGAELQLPDQYCADPACTETRPVDREWLLLRLQAMLATTSPTP